MSPTLSTEVAPSWRFASRRCTAGPADRPFEECHEYHSIAIVREGRFTYHGEHGKRLLETGSILLGNAAM
jgi:hypothetical protein